MAKTVNGAFTEFNRVIVNLESERTKKAINSRDWLINQLESFPEKIDDFPKLYAGMSIKFGSFARRTKIRPLDDIDLILTLSAEGSTYQTRLYGQRHTLIALESATKLQKLTYGNNIINSKMVVNKIVSSLSRIDQYKQAETHRKQEAATLQLNSYEWNFDIVPAFYTDTGYYLIPDGGGGWKATDPRIDQNRSTEINQKHDGRILQIIRTVKYWSRYAQIPNLSSYLLENMALNFFDSTDEISEYIDVNLLNFWNYLKTEIYSEVADPKGFQGSINQLTTDEKEKVSLKSVDAHNKGYEAYQIETVEKNQEKAINKWRSIFGDKFPKYE